MSWTAPDNTGRPPIESYDLRYRQGTRGSWTDGPQDVTGLAATITGLHADSEYHVQVRATNDEGDGERSPSGSGTTNVQNGVVAIDSDPGTRGIGDTLAVGVQFDAAMTVTGTPRLALEIGAERRQADYAASIVNLLAFNYTVAEGDEDTDGIEVPADALGLNGGAISAGGIDALLKHRTYSLPHVRVDGVRPTVVSAEAFGDGTAMLVTFSENIASAEPGMFIIYDGDAAVTDFRSVGTISGPVVTLELAAADAVTSGETLTLTVLGDAARDEAGNGNADSAGNPITNNALANCTGRRRPARRKSGRPR